MMTKSISDKILTKIQTKPNTLDKALTRTHLSLCLRQILTQ